MAQNTKINPDDFFRFNAPFRQWLFTFKNKQLSEIPAEDAKKLFADEFVDQWNDSKLPEKYYIYGPAMKTDFSNPPPITKEKSSFGSFGFSKQEQEKLFNHKVVEKSSQDHNYADKSSSKSTDRSFFKRRQADLDEICPKKEGKAKIIEDRRIKSAHTRFERSQDVEISDEALFNGSTTFSSSSKRYRNADLSDDYNALLRIEREKKARRELEFIQRRTEKEQTIKEKLEKHNQREAEVQEMLRKMIRQNKK